MKYQLTNFKPIPARAPLALIAIRIATQQQAAVANRYQYIPLALVFRHLQTGNSHITQTLHYLNHSGDKLVITPRIQLIIQLARQLRIMVNQALPFAQQLHRQQVLPHTFSNAQPEQSSQPGLSTVVPPEQLIFRQQSSPIERAQMTTQVMEQQTSGAGQPQLSFQQTSKQQPDTQQGISDTATTATTATSYSSFVQQTISTHHALSLLSSVVARRFLMLNNINESSQPAIQSKSAMPSLFAVAQGYVHPTLFNQKHSSIRQFYNSDSESGLTPDNSNRLDTQNSQVFSFAKQLKSAQAVVSLLIRRQRRGSAIQFVERFPMLLNVVNKQAFKRIETPIKQLFNHRDIQGESQHMFATTARYLTKQALIVVQQTIQHHSHTKLTVASANPRILVYPSLSSNRRHASGQISPQKQARQHNAEVLQSRENRHYQADVAVADVVYRTEKPAVKTAAVAEPSIPQPTPVASPPIDIERLSTDVWRQLEQRIRIERERHGRL